METKHNICYNLCTMFGDVKMNKSIFDRSKEQIVHTEIVGEEVV